MSKLYNKTTVSYLENKLNTGDAKIITHDTYNSVLPTKFFQLGDITITFSEFPNHPDRFDSAAYLKEGVNREYYKEWNQYPIATHLKKDLRKGTRDKDGNIPYKTIIFANAKGEEQRALIRYLFEIDDMDADSEECVNYYNTYTDFIFQNKPYLIIKICNNDYPYYGNCESINVEVEDLYNYIQVATNVELKVQKKSTDSNEEDSETVNPLF